MTFEFGNNLFNNYALFSGLFCDILTPLHGCEIFRIMVDKIASICYITTVVESNPQQVNMGAEG